MPKKYKSIFVKYKKGDLRNNGVDPVSQKVAARKKDCWPPSKHKRKLRTLKV